MKTNLFRVKEKKEKRIIIEEERIKNPFLLFLKRNKNLILISLIVLLFCMFLASTGIAFSLFRGSNDYDITYIEGSETIDSTTDPEVDDEDIKDELLGEIARENGVVLLTKNIMTTKGDVISYYTDGTAVVVQSSGKIYRISTNKKGDYGISENGKIDDTAKKILVEATTSTLMDGTIVTYYSDGSAKVQYKEQTYFVRDSNNIKLEDGSTFNNLAPSVVAPVKELKNIHNNKAITFTNQVPLVMINGKKYIVNKNTPITTTDNSIIYNKKNAFSVISEKTYKDGNIITHFQNGSLIITEPNGNITYVKKSGDLLLNNKKLYEIIPNPTGNSNSRTTINTPAGRRVTYFDNGEGLIINKDGTREHIADNEDIIYDDNGNIIGNPVKSEQIERGKNEKGQIVINFSNGKSQVIRENGTSYLTDTSKITFIPDKEEKPEEIPEDIKPNHPQPNPNPGEGIYISEAENEYNEFKNIEDTKFVIKNNNKSSRTLRITIEEVTDYAKYNTARLDPQYVKFQATIGDDYIPATQLTKNAWTNEIGVTNYIIYEGTIDAKTSKQVALSLYVDYARLDNSHQGKGFVGTIKIYLDDNFQDDD